MEYVKPNTDINVIFNENSINNNKIHQLHFFVHPEILILVEEFIFSPSSEQEKKVYEKKLI